SEYFLNRAPCRLRDIQDLVRGTGLGADSGVVIESKMIDALLSDRPDDRRELFEEAAGVSLYRDRRRSTERRLEETTIDLSRLDDLINEVQSQVRSLARQRKRAERHAELSARRFNVELTLAQREIEAWGGELARLEEQVAALREQLPALEEGVRAADRGREDAHGARAVAEGQRAELARLVNAQQQDVMRLESELAVAAERQRNAVARRERAEQERRAGEERGSQLAGDREAAAAERARLAEELAAAREQLEERVGAEDEVRRAVAVARQAAEQAERRLRELSDAARRMELDREGVARELDEAAQRAAALGAEREHLAQQLELARGALALAESVLEERREAAEEMAEALAVARAAAQEARAGEAAARQALFRAEQELTALQGKSNALEALERERVGLAPAAAKLLKERERFEPGAVLGPLSDYVSTSAASAVLLERFLGATVHAILVRDRAAAEAVRAWHAQANPGPLLLLPLDVRHAEEAGGALADLAEVAEPARDWARVLLSRVEAIDGGAAFVDARGAVWLPGATAGPGPLQRRAELASLRAELAAAEAARQGASDDADAAKAALAEADEAAAVAGDDAAAAQQGVRRAQEQREEADRRVKRAERELQNVEAMAEKLAARTTELHGRADAIDERLRGIETESEAAQSRVEDERERLSEMEEQLEEAREARTRWQVEEAQIQARLQVASDRERRLSAELDTASARLQALVAELTDIEQSDSVLAERIAEWQMDIDARRAALADGRARLQGAEDAVREADARLEETEQRAGDARTRHAQASDALHHAELRLTELSGRRQAIRERLEAEWRRPLEEMLAQVAPVEVDDETLRAEMATLRSQLDELGQVNPLAIEEHEEELKRLDFLTGQRNDLAAAKQSLQQAIREIDTTARELFLATFVQVRENFRQIFMTLFGGGECDLRLENPEAPLDCDIEIHASPRGKRTQRIHLLSSGERALVALSLLFGIFLTKPSPFCLLDEVDAPLDDQNVGRFVRMLNQFKTRTQFIVITHNPRTTTEAADAVYGVTRQEPGVSSVVSVRMRERVHDGIVEAVETDGASEDTEEVAAPA
ncbi:MAG TPA: chromosome segregation protein SMC, partial [Gemmatimonadaceae bacterium]|nr:chromosome segregation protein SMC [Gemmatimonadaceae bacterium]